MDPSTNAAFFATISSVVRGTGAVGAGSWPLDSGADAGAAASDGGASAGAVATAAGWPADSEAGASDSGIKGVSAGGADFFDRYVRAMMLILHEVIQVKRVRDLA